MLTRFIIAAILTVSICLMPTINAFADSYTTADRQTFFNDVTDNFATMGKSDREARKIRLERRQLRRDIRLQKARDGKQKRMNKKLHKQQSDILKKIDAKKQAKQNASAERNRRLEERQKRKKEELKAKINSSE